jgi:hypothetical protein
MWNELVGQIPGLSPLLAQKFINRAYEAIRESRHWSFQMAEGILFAPNVISTGSVSVTQFSATFTMNAAAITALNLLANPVITKRQLRISGGPIYSIATYTDATGVGTFDRLYRETTNAAAEYDISRIYYGTPLNGAGTEVTDFLRYRSIVNFNSSYRLHLNWTKEQLDMFDPQRTSSGDPYVLASHKADSSNQPVWELWPSPQSELTFLCSYQRRGVDFTVAGNESAPSAIGEDLIIEKALELGCDWANKNQGRLKELKGTNWLLASAKHNRNFKEALIVKEKQDEETFNQNYLVDDFKYPYFPIDSNYIQAHAFGGY